MSTPPQPRGGDGKSGSEVRALYKAAVEQIESAQAEGGGADRLRPVIDGFDRIVDLAPDSPLGYLGRGYARALAGDDEQALGDLDRAIEVGTDLPQVYATRARFYETRGAPEKALEDYDEAVARSPRDALLHRDRASVRLVAGNWAAALEDLDVAVDIDPELLDVRRMRATILESLRRHEQALGELDFLIAHGDDSATVHRDRGNARGGLGDFRAAIADFTAALERDPSLLDANLARAHAYAALGDDEAAVADYSHALALDPRLVKAYRRRGEALQRLGRSQEALADLDRFIQLGADSAEAYALRARAREGVGDLDGALDDYASALERDSASLAVYLGRGRVHLARGAVELSLADYDAAVSVDPTCPDSYIGRAAAYQALGDAEQAAGDHGRAVALDPVRAEAHRGIVLADLTMGEEYQDRRLVGRADERYRAALRHADEGLAATSGDLALRLCRAAALRSLGACDQALHELRELIAAAAPGDVATVARLRCEAGHALLEWGRLTHQPERLEEALAELERAGSGPDAAQALELAGKTLTGLGRYQEALERFTTVAELTGASPWALLGMGKVHLLLGEDAEALGAFARLLQVRPLRDATERWARAGRALALRRLGHKDPGHVAEKALKRSRDASSYVERGSRLEFFGALEDAERDFRKAVTLAPSWGAAHHVLARNLVESAREREAEKRVAWLEEASREAIAAIERHRTGAAEPHYRHTAGRAYLGLGRTDEALEHLREATRINPGHVGMREDLQAAEQAAQTAARQ